MERRLFVKSIGSGGITAVCYLPPKREVIVGHEGKELAIISYKQIHY